MTQKLEELIIRNIAFIRCTHTKDKPCPICLLRVGKELSSLPVMLIKDIAMYEEGCVKDYKNITPLTWIHAFELVKLTRKYLE